MRGSEASSLEPHLCMWLVDWAGYPGHRRLSLHHKQHSFEYNFLLGGRIVVQLDSCRFVEEVGEEGEFLISRKVVEQYTGCPKKNALLSFLANISGFKGAIGQSLTSFENYMFSAFI